MYWVCWHYRGIKVTCSLICARLNKPLSSKYGVRRFGILNFVIQEKSEPINDSVSCQPALWPRSLAVAHWVCHKTKRTRKYAHATAAATRGRGRRRRTVVSHNARGWAGWTYLQLCTSMAANRELYATAKKACDRHLRVRHKPLKLQKDAGKLLLIKLKATV